MNTWKCLNCGTANAIEHFSCARCGLGFGLDGKSPPAEMSDRERMVRADLHNCEERLELETAEHDQTRRELDRLRVRVLELERRSLRP